MISGILLTILLVAINAFFVAAEFALVKIRASQLEVDTSKHAKMSLKILANLDSYLSGCQLGITIASLAIGAVGEPLVEKIFMSLFHAMNLEISHTLLEAISITISLVLLTLIHVVLGEQAPKIIALQSAKKTTLAIAYPLYFFHTIFKPAIWLLNNISNYTLKLMGFHVGSHQDIHSIDELKNIIDQGNITGAIEDNEHEMIKNVFDFNHKVAHQIMIPRQKINYVSVTDSIEEIVSKVINEGYSRIPVFKDNVDNIIGILYSKDLLKIHNSKEEFKIENIIKKAHFIHEDKNISDLLKDLQIKKLHMAIVVNEYGSVTGLLTIEDIIEELVGEIQDEHDDEAPIVRKISDTEFIVNALSNLDDINDLIPLRIDKEDAYETLSGYLIHLLDRIPNVNDTIHTDQYHFTVTKKINQTVHSVKLKIFTDELSETV